MKKGDITKQLKLTAINKIRLLFDPHLQDYPDNIRYEKIKNIVTELESILKKNKETNYAKKT
jgi:hypothetical protein